MQEPMPSRATIRAVFLDIDGTLVGKEDRVSPGVRRSIQVARARGCAIVLCTGRSRYSTEPVAAQLGHPLSYAVTSNGGVVLHLETGEALCRDLLPIPTALEVCRHIVALGSEPYVYKDGVEPGHEGACVLYHPELPRGPWAIPPRYRPHAAILEELPFAPVSVSAYGMPEKMRPLGAKLRAQLGEDVCLIESGSDKVWGVEVFVRDVNKRRGLELVAERLGIRREEVMAVGDHINDLEMLEWAGLGVAMGNAVPEAKAAADVVTGTLEEDGVAQAIARFVL